MRRWIEQSPVTVGVVLAVLGFVAIFLGWNGAADRDYVTGQIPYLISGGLLGLGLIGVGLCVIIVQSLRRETSELAARLDQLAEAVRDAGAGPVATVGPTVVPAEDMVIAGRSTYHLPTCRLVEHRTDLQAMSPEDARDRGLSPCRICKPAA